MGHLGAVSSSSFDLIATGWGNIIALSQAWLTDTVNGLDTFDAVFEERFNKVLNYLTIF